MRREKPPEVIVIGVEPATTGWSLDLSPEVAGVLPALLSTVQDTIIAFLAGSGSCADRATGDAVDRFIQACRFVDKAYLRPFGHASSHPRPSY